MKTFTLFIIIGLFLGQLSFGTGNETCCPDSTSVNKAMLATEAQLELLQTESRQVALSPSSISEKVATKLAFHTQLNNVQLETELSEASVPQNHLQTLQLKLNKRMVVESNALLNSK